MVVVSFDRHHVRKNTQRIDSKTELVYSQLQSIEPPPNLDQVNI
jgi:hypothetical protein